MVDIVPEPLKQFAIDVFGRYDKIALLVGTAVLLAAFAAGHRRAGRSPARGRLVGIAAFAGLGVAAALTRAGADAADTLPALVGGGSAALVLWAFVAGPLAARPLALAAAHPAAGRPPRPLPSAGPCPSPGRSAGRAAGRAGPRWPGRGDRAVGRGDCRRPWPGRLRVRPGRRRVGAVESTDPESRRRFLRGAGLLRGRGDRGGGWAGTGSPVARGSRRPARPSRCPPRRRWRRRCRPVRICRWPSSRPTSPRTAVSTGSTRRWWCRRSIRRPGGCAIHGRVDATRSS